MQTEHGIQDELRELESRLAGLPALPPFRVPAGYFDVLPQQLAAVAAGEPQPGWSKDMPFRTPPGYFDTLAETLRRPALPFSTPTGYFDSLPQQLLAGVKTAAAPATKTVAFRPAWRKVLPWIAAAAVTAGVWIGIRPPAPLPSADTRALRALAIVNRDSIGAYVESHADEFDPESLESALAGGQVTDFRKAVSELHDDEIENYLNDASPDAPSINGI